MKKAHIVPDIFPAEFESKIGIRWVAIARVRACFHFAHPSEGGSAHERPCDACYASVRYDTMGGAVLKNGQAVSPPDASMLPDVELNATAPGCLYTMVMTDPDAPSPDEPKMRGETCTALIHSTATLAHKKS